MQNRLIKYKLNQGDIIRIGRITCRIKDIIFNNNEKDNKNNVIKLDDNIKLEETSTPKLFTKNEKKQIKKCKNMKNSETSNKIKKNKKISKKSCRICYLEEDDKENFGKINAVEVVISEKIPETDINKIKTELKQIYSVSPQTVNVKYKKGISE